MPRLDQASGKIELAACLERLHHPVERADVEVHPAAARALRDADHRRREHAGLGDERAARLGDDLERIWQPREAHLRSPRPKPSSGGTGSQ